MALELELETFEQLRTCEKKENSIEALGWTPREALETRIRLNSFAEDWNCPGMEAYDEM